MIYVTIRETLSDGRILDRRIAFDDFVTMVLGSGEGGSSISLPLDYENPAQITNTPDLSVFAKTADVDSKVGGIETSLSTKADLVDGVIPSYQLPGFVDDILEFDSLEAFPETGESGKIYLAKDTNKTYRWGGSTYVAIVSDVALGETSGTAYPGNLGKANADSILSLNTKITDLEGNLSDTELVFVENFNALPVPAPEEPVEGTIYASTAKLYLVKDEKKLYVFNGTEYEEYSKDTTLRLGETESDAFPGNRGKELEDNFTSLMDSFNSTSDFSVVDILQDELEEGKQVQYFGHMFTKGVNLFGSITEAIQAGETNLVINTGMYDGDIALTADTKMVGNGDVVITGKITGNNVSLQLKDLKFRVTATQVNKKESGKDYHIIEISSSKQFLVSNCEFTCIATGSADTQTALGCIMFNTANGDYTSNGTCIVENSTFNPTFYTPSETHPNKSCPAISVGAMADKLIVRNNICNGPVYLNRGFKDAVVINNRIFVVDSTCLSLNGVGGSRGVGKVDIINNLFTGEDTNGAIKIDSLANDIGYSAFVAGNIANISGNFFGNQSSIVLSEENTKFSNNMVHTTESTAEEFYPASKKLVYAEDIASKTSEDVTTIPEEGTVAIDGSKGSVFTIKPTEDPAEIFDIVPKNLEPAKPIFVSISCGADKYKVCGTNATSFNTEASNFTNATYRITKISKDDNLVELVKFTPGA